MGFLQKILDFRSRALSEADGTPSAARLIASRMSWVAAGILLILTAAVIKSDAGKATVILTALPGIIFALTALFSSTYGANQIGRWLQAKAANANPTTSPDESGDGTKDSKVAKHSK